MSTATGVVKWFNNAKGYGFVTPDQGEQDIFIHFSAIAMEGYKTLKEGQKVEFELQEGPKGLHAANLQAGEDDHGSECIGHDMAHDDANVFRSGSTRRVHEIAFPK